MLEIRASQLSVFEEIARKGFENEMMEHTREFAPALVENLDQPRLRDALRRLLRHAVQHGLTNRGPLRQFVENALLFGSAFDSDPQYPWLAATLKSRLDQMVRSEKLYVQVRDYQRKAYGQGGMHTKRVLRSLLNFVQGVIETSNQEHTVELDARLRDIFPEKAALVGDGGLRDLTHGAVSQTRRQKLPEQEGSALIAVLMFAFGHGCVDDPFHGWIKSALADEKTMPSDARCERLRGAAVGQFEHLLANLSA